MYLYYFFLSLYCIVKYCIVLSRHILVYFCIVFFVCFLPMWRINVFIMSGVQTFYRASDCLCMQSAILFYQFCLSVRLSSVGMCQTDCTYRRSFSTFWYFHYSSFLSPTVVTKFQKEPSHRGGGCVLKCTYIHTYIKNICIAHIILQ